MTLNGLMALTFLCAKLLELVACADSGTDSSAGRGQADNDSSTDRH